MGQVSVSSLLNKCCLILTENLQIMIILYLFQMFLKELAEQTGGRYHCYVSTSDVSEL